MSAPISAPISVSRSAVIDAPVDRVWALLRDFNGHDRWHPAVAESAIDGGRPSDAVGAVRRFRLVSGERLAERLLTLSDRARRFSYAITETEVPLADYTAHLELRPITDGNRTLWRWWSRFRAPAGREGEMAALVGDGVYQAGFDGVRAYLGIARAAPRRAEGALTGRGVVIARHGGPEVLEPAPVTAPAPGPGEAQLRQTAVGVNYIDVYSRTGYFDLVRPPGVPGMEAAGTVTAIGPGVTHLRVGERVAYACAPPGAYASVRTMPADLVLPLPPSLDDRSAAAGLLKGVTAWFLLHRVHRLRAGETVLVYAPAGGVGRMLVQWASALGATVIGATSSARKARLAEAAGAAHVVMPGAQSLEAQVMDLTDGRGADVIFDAVGRDSFEHSVAALATCGHLVSYGQVSGDIGAREIGPLAARSVTLSRPNYGHYTDTRAKMAEAAEGFFAALAARRVSVEIGQSWPLARAAEAHRALEARETTGSTILIPEDTA